MAEKMLERLRKAAQDANVNESKYDLTDHYADAIVRAILQEMMKPTNKQIKACEYLEIGYPWIDMTKEMHLWECEAKGFWQAMLTAILEEGQ